MDIVTLREVVQDQAFGFPSSYPLNLKTGGLINNGESPVEEKKPVFIVYVGGIEVGRMLQSEMATLKEDVFVRTMSHWSWLRLLKEPIIQVFTLLGKAALITPALMILLLYYVTDTGNFSEFNQPILLSEALQAFRSMFHHTFYYALTICILVKMGSLAWRTSSDSNTEDVSVLKTLNRNNPFQFNLEKELKSKFNVLNPGKLTVQLSA